MELNTILIILGVIALIVLVVHGVWANRREKSTFFKNQNNFVDDSRVEKEKQEKVTIKKSVISKSTLEGNPIAKNKKNLVADDITSTKKADDITVTSTDNLATVVHDKNVNVNKSIGQENFAKETEIQENELEVKEKQSPIQEKVNFSEEKEVVEDNLSIEEAVGKIKIHVPKSNLSKTKNLAELSIAELEASIEDEDEGFNTHAPQVREQLANLSSKKVELNLIKSDTQDFNIEKETIESKKINDKDSLPINVKLDEHNDVEDKTELKLENTTPESQEKDEKLTEVKQPKVVMLYIVAPEGKDFTGEDLENCFEKEGFLFGDKQIYHRHTDLNSTSPVLFSVANVQNPGIFNPKEMEDFTTFGIALFMQLPSAYGHDLTNLRLMITTAKAMAKELNGALLTDQQKPFDQVAENEYLNKVK